MGRKKIAAEKKTSKTNYGEPRELKTPKQRKGNDDKIEFSKNFVIHENVEHNKSKEKSKNNYHTQCVRLQCNDLNTPTGATAKHGSSFTDFVETTVSMT